MCTRINNCKSNNLITGAFQPEFLIMLGMCFIISACLPAKQIPSFYRDYDPELPLKVRIAEYTQNKQYHREHFYFSSQPDQQIPAILARPTGDKKVPAVIFLHGIGQRKEFIDQIAHFFTENDLAIVTFDQYDRGERRVYRGSDVRAGLALRRRNALTVIETRRLIDYLQSRDDIAADRIYLVGASYGAITGATAAAFDERIQAAILTYGGGHLPTLANNETTRETLGWLIHPLRYLLAAFFHPADPINYVERISPRPLLMQNGIDDEIIPAESAKRLYEAAKEPKQIIWYDSKHIGRDEKTVTKVLTDAIEWLLKQDAVIVRNHSLD